MKGIAKDLSVGFPTYVTPHCIIVEIDLEGTLCQSIINGGVSNEPVIGDETPII